MNTLTSKPLDEILHSIFVLGISAAALFMRNQSTQQHADKIINLMQTTILPLADSLLNPAQAPLPLTPQQ